MAISSSFGCTAALKNNGRPHEIVDMARAKREASLGQLLPGVKSVMLTARHDDGLGLFGREQVQVFMQLIFDLFYIEYNQCYNPSLLVFFGHRLPFELLHFL